VKNTAHKAAFYLAALCSALPLLMGASASIRDDVVKIDPVPFMPTYARERRDVANEPQTHDKTGTIAEWLEVAPAPALQNESALCHLLVTLPSGPVFCYWVQF
jgi:short subunit fatty acids transporter